MHKLGFLMFCLSVTILWSFQCSGQSEDSVSLIVEEMPVFFGCDKYETNEEKQTCTKESVMDYLSLIEYPKKARMKEMEGRVIIRFIVDIDGSVSGTEIIQSSGHELLDEVAQEHIEDMPMWFPGRQKGKVVRAQYVIPVNFKLNKKGRDDPDEE